MKLILNIIWFPIKVIDSLYRSLKSNINTLAVNQKNLKKRSLIGSETVIQCAENIYLGEGSYINGGQLIASKDAKIIIGDNCLISYNTHLRTDMHKFMNANVLIKNQGHIHRDIVIGNDVWIGYGVQVMAGVHINDGAVIGAGSIVTKDIPSYSVAVGVPARVISERREIDRQVDES